MAFIVMGVKLTLAQAPESVQEVWPLEPGPHRLCAFGWPMPSAWGGVLLFPPHRDGRYTQDHDAVFVALGIDDEYTAYGNRMRDGHAGGGLG